MADPTYLPEALKREGLNVTVLDGAMQRGHGDFANRYLIPFVHHTGASGTPGPWAIARHPELGLCSQLYLGRDGKVVLCGIGIAYHAGTGSWPGIPANQGNQYSIGTEAENNGTEGWGTAQYGSYLRIVRAINRAQGAPLNKVVAHKEYGAVQGKWDPGSLDMKLFRQRLLVADAPEKVIINMIDLEAKENPWVGVRKAKPGAEGETRIGRDGKGRLVAYDNAHIYFHPSTGAHAIPHADPRFEGSGLFEAYRRRGYELGELGYPVRDFSKIDGGAVMSFQGGILYVHDTLVGADGRKDHVVRGVIGQRWALEGYEDGPLGWPISDEVPNGTGGVMQMFEHGSLEWDKSGAVKRLADLGLSTQAVTNLNVVHQSGPQAGMPIAATHGVELIAA
ncbi:lysin A [Gordonia phage Upyo]|nr:lysin A [Gordonia phage Upyo]